MMAPSRLVTFRQYVDTQLIPQYNQAVGVTGYNVKSWQFDFYDWVHGNTNTAQQRALIAAREKANA